MIWETYCITARLMLAKTDSPWTHGKETSLRTGLSRASFFYCKKFHDSRSNFPSLDVYQAKQTKGWIFNMKYEEIREFDKNVQCEIGQRIQEARLAKGIAGVEVAAYLGIGKNQMSRIETGRANCTIPQLYVLAQLLDCSVEYILFGKKPSLPYTNEQDKCIKSLIASFSK